MLLSRIQRRMSDRSDDLQRVFLWLTALAFVYFGSFAGWAILDFDRYYRAMYRAAPIPSLLLFVVGVAVASIGLLARRGGYFLLGAAIILHGAGNGVPLLFRGNVQYSRQFLLALLIGSAAVCLVGFLVQLKARQVKR